MDRGLAQTYGSGQGQNVTHHYAGTLDKKKDKKVAKGKCKKPKGK